VPILLIGPTMVLIIKGDFAECHDAVENKGAFYAKATMLLKELRVSFGRAAKHVGAANAPFQNLSGSWCVRRIEAAWVGLLQAFWQDEDEND
jgi:hypothetical protein